MEEREAVQFRSEGIFPSHSGGAGLNRCGPVATARKALNEKSTEL